MKPGYVDKNHFRYFRCMNCGDSNKNTWKAHAFVDEKGSTYCFRCGHSTQLSLEAMLTLSLGMADLDEILDERWEVPAVLARKDALTRPTLLTKYHAPTDPLADSFSMRDRHGRMIGWHTRRPDMRFFANEGERGVCWPGADDEISLVSTRHDPITLVEGAYDCTGARHTSAFGSITYNTFRHLRNQHVIVHPDPDVIATTRGRRRFVEMLQRANDNLCWIHGIISSDADPDVMTKSIYLTLPDAVAYVRRECAA
jgi:hypothetical protein